MILKIEVSSSRDEIEWIDTNEPFSKCIDEMEEYSFRAFVSIFEEDTLVAEVYGVVFDEEKILNKGQDIVDIADMYDVDTVEAMSNLTKSKIYKQELDENLIFTSPYSCYIEKVYVKPGYRRKGIGKYIFNNLYGIFLHCLNINIRCFVIYPKPQQPNEKGIWENLSDEGMKKLMINVIKNSGYRRIGRSGYFAINCMV